MKYLLFLPLLFPALSVLSQDSVEFRASFLPEHAYHNSSLQQNTTTIRFDSASQEVLDALKQKGLENPTIKQTSVTTVAVLTTGKVGDSARMPVIMAFEKSEDSDGKTVLPAGTKFYGKVGQEGMPRVDSVVAPGMDENTKAGVAKVVESIFSQVSLPNVKVGIGQAVTQDNPINLPIGGGNMTMMMHITYTLTGITQGIAHFNMAMTIEFQAKASGVPIPLSGDGTGGGSMEFDTQSHFPIRQELHFTMGMTMKQPGFAMHIQVDNKTSQTSIIKGL